MTPSEISQRLIDFLAECGRRTNERREDVPPESYKEKRERWMRQCEGTER